MLNYQAGLQKMAALDRQQASTITTQINAEASKEGAKRWMIQQDLQTSLFQRTQAVTVDRAKAADKAFKAFSEYIEH